MVLMGFGLLIVYFVLFWRMAKLYQEETKQYIEVFGSQRFAFPFGMILIFSAFILPGVIMPIAAMTLGLAWTGYETYRHHKIMRDLGFNQLYEKRLLRISVLPPIALICLLGGFLWVGLSK